MTTPNPKYIARGGDLVMAPPLKLLSTTMYSFLVPADLGALTTMIDQQLNAVGGGYKPLGPFVAIVCADVVQSFSTTPPDSSKGWNAERDFGIWVPVVRGDRIGWYLPYVFVDNVAAMVTGRELYGFFKQTADLACPASPSSPGRFAIDALIMRTFTPQTQAETARLMTLTSTESSVAPDGTWSSLREAADAVAESVKGASWWVLLKNLIEALVTGDVPIVFLKQFRDCVDPTTACYQAVVEAPAHLDKFHGGWFTHPHDIEIADAASHPIVRECGLSGSSLRSELGFWCKIDFTMQVGQIIAEQ